LRKKFSGKGVTVTVYALDPESMRLSTQIVAALRMAGFTTLRHPTMFPGIRNFPEGINITGPDTAFVDALKDALQHKGRLALTDPNWRSIVGGLTESFITTGTPDADIFIGVKPLKDGALRDGAAIDP
jgi:hypothetical protein